MRRQLELRGKRLTTILTAGLLGALAGLVALPAAVQAQNAMGFDFQITLSDKAARRLASSRESITILASFYGDPKKTAEKYANQVGQIDLGTERLDLPGKGQTVHILGNKVRSTGLKQIASPVMVNVNVFTARKTSKDNLLSCDFIDTELQSVKAQPIALHCSLIEENIPMQTRP
jgi:hypothetical protein